MGSPLTSGVHHVGLAVSRLEESARFFTDLLGWTEVKRRDDYPAIFVSDGNVMVTLWAVQPKATAFDRHKNVGLHHLAISTRRHADLIHIYQKLIDNNIEIEFAPTEMNGGPAIHLMCYEPSGIRVEFFWAGIDS